MTRVGGPADTSDPGARDISGSAPGDSRHDVAAPLRHATNARLSRRGLLVGAIAIGALAACGSNDDNDDDDANGTGGQSAGGADGAVATAGAAGPWTLVQRFPPNVQTTGPVRLPISLSTGSAQLVEGPDTLNAQVIDADGHDLGEPITASRRDVTPGAYYDFRTVVDDPGVYYLRVDGGPPAGAAFQIFDAADVAVPKPGDPLPPFDTPTFDDHRGVDPICTRSPEPCPFHDVTLTEALAAGKPVAYVVGTPAFCQTGSCAPALESLVDLHDRFGDAYTFVHAEVYTDDTATTQAPALAAAHLEFEPVLFVTDADGIVVERLDAVWNQSELSEVLARDSA